MKEYFGFKISFLSLFFSAFILSIERVDSCFTSCLGEEEAMETS